MLRLGKRMRSVMEKRENSSEDRSGNSAGDFWKWRPRKHSGRLHGIEGTTGFDCRACNCPRGGFVSYASPLHKKRSPQA